MESIAQSIDHWEIQPRHISCSKPKCMHLDMYIDNQKRQNLSQEAKRQGTQAAEQIIVTRAAIFHLFSFKSLPLKHYALI